MQVTQTAFCHNPISQQDQHLNSSLYSGGTSFVPGQTNQTDDMMKQSMRNRKTHDRNIEQILLANKGEWSSLYQHPKMMQMYYWKDDNNASRIKRTMELKNVMSNPPKSRL